MNLKLINYINLTLDEHKSLIGIRNLDYIRVNMIDDSEIMLNNHLEWVKRLPGDQTKRYYAIFLDEKIVGGINITNINMENKTSSWGIFIKQNLNPLIPSIATYIIIDKIFYDLDIETLSLEVNKNNVNAYKFDKNFGFIDIGEIEYGNNKYHIMEMRKIDWEDRKKSPLLKIIKNTIDKLDIVLQD